MQNGNCIPFLRIQTSFRPESCRRVYAAYLQKARPPTTHLRGADAASQQHARAADAASQQLTWDLQTPQVNNSPESCRRRKSTTHLRKSYWTTYYFLLFYVVVFACYHVWFCLCLFCLWWIIVSDFVCRLLHILLVFICLCLTYFFFILCRFLFFINFILLFVCAELFII